MGTKGHERTTSPPSPGRPLSCLPPSFLSSSSFSSFRFLFVQAHSNKDLLFPLYFKPSLICHSSWQGLPHVHSFPMCFLPRPSLQSKPATNPLMVPALIISCSPCTRLFHYGLTRMWGGAWLPGMVSSNLGAALPSPHASCPLPFCSRRPLLVFSWRKPKSWRAIGSHVPLMLILFLIINH